MTRSGSFPEGSEIRHVVFDIGGVLIRYEPELPYRTLIPDAEKRRWFLEHVCNSAWNLEQDRGRPWPKAEAELIAKHPGWEAMIRAFRLHWHDMVPSAYDDTVAILQGLVTAGVDVTMLTNFAADTFREAQARFPFFRSPRGVTVSGEVGLVKPDPAIYALHAEAFELDPAACLFFDDMPRNVEAAQAAGWHARRFESAAQMERDLRLAQLLPEV